MILFEKFGQQVKRIDALFDLERTINGLASDERLRVRQIAPLVTALEAWLPQERSRLSRSASVVQPIDYALNLDDFARFLDDGRICLTQCRRTRIARIALGRKSWLFAGSEPRPQIGRQSS